MSTDDLRKKRKDQHLELALKHRAEGDFFADYHLLRPSLPEHCLADTDLTTELFQKKLAAPLLINAMTGGTDKGKQINRRLAEAASELNIGLALGSASVLAHDPSAIDTFKIAREYDPEGLILLNFNPDTPLDVIEKAFDEIKADGIQIHVNAVQESAMAEGDRDFKWMDKIAAISKRFPGKVMVKEVGFGLDPDSVKALMDKAMVHRFDVSGRGGTDFVGIECERSGKNLDWLADTGLSTLESLALIRREVPRYTFGPHIIASGGIKTPLDALKCFSLGAEAIGLAGPVLEALNQGKEKEFLQGFIEGLRLVCNLYGLDRPSRASKLKGWFTGDTKALLNSWGRDDV